MSCFHSFCLNREYSLHCSTQVPRSKFLLILLSNYLNQKNIRKMSVSPFLSLSPLSLSSFPLLFRFQYFHLTMEICQLIFFHCVGNWLTIKVFASRFLRLRRNVVEKDWGEIIKGIRHLTIWIRRGWIIKLFKLCLPYSKSERVC